jgi:hypothetical protein
MAALAGAANWPRALTKSHFNAVAAASVQGRGETRRPAAYSELIDRTMSCSPIFGHSHACDGDCGLEQAIRSTTNKSTTEDDQSATHSLGPNEITPPIIPVEN